MAEETTGNVTSVDEELLEKIAVDVSQEKGNLSKRKNHISSTVAAWIKSFAAMISAVQTELRSLNVKNGTGEGSLNIGNTEGNESSGTFALSTGKKTSASGNNSLTGGYNTIASNNEAAALGNSTKAAGKGALSTGGYTQANEDYTFAAGYGNTALKKQAAVFGKSNRSDGVNAFVAGLFNKALSDNQFVRGKYCIPDDTGKYVEIVGNGTGSEYSNAYTLDWEGNASFAGTVSAMGQVLATADSVEAIPVKDLGRFTGTREEFETHLAQYTTQGVYTYELQETGDWCMCTKGFMFVTETGTDLNPEGEHEPDWCTQILYDDYCHTLMCRQMHASDTEYGAFEEMYPKLGSGKIPQSYLPVIPITGGGTGAMTAADARANLGIGDTVTDLGPIITDVDDDNLTFDRFWTDVTNPGIYKCQVQFSWCESSEDCYLLVGRQDPIDVNTPVWQLAILGLNLSENVNTCKPAMWWRMRYHGGDEWSNFKELYPSLSDGEISESYLPTIPIEKGGTGGKTAADARTNLGAASQEDLDALEEQTAEVQNLNVKKGKMDGSVITLPDGRTLTTGEEVTENDAIRNDINGETYVVGKGALVLNDCEERTYYTEEELAGTTQNSLGDRVKSGNVATGEYALAGGSENTASGNASVALGLENVSAGSRSVTLGHENEAHGFSSVAIGDTNSADNRFAVAIGHDNESTNTHAVSLGYGNKSSGNTSLALGRGTLSEGDYAVAMGHESAAGGEAATALGCNTIASGKYALAVGVGNDADGEASFAGGSGSAASGKYSFAFGNKAQATAPQAVAIGWNTQATADRAYAIGSQTKAAGKYGALATGSLTEANGDASTAMGYKSVADGKYSTAIGHLSVANGERSIAVGNNTVAAEVDQTAMGKYNAEDANALLMLGNGTSDTARSNAVTVDWEGNVWFAGDVTVGADKKKLATTDPATNETAGLIRTWAPSGGGARMVSSNWTITDLRRQCSAHPELTNDGIHWINFDAGIPGAPTGLSGAYKGMLEVYNEVGGFVEGEPLYMHRVLWIQEAEVSAFSSAQVYDEVYDTKTEQFKWAKRVSREEYVALEDRVVALEGLLGLGE